MNHEAHEEHEGDKGHRSSLGMRLRSPLTEEAEQAMTATIGCALAVHRALGPGFLESIYKRAMQIELNLRGLSFESEKPVCVPYRGFQIDGQRVDLVVGGLIIVELKAVSRLDDVHRAQLMSYLRTMGLRGGLLINFRVPVLKADLERIVL